MFLGHHIRLQENKLEDSKVIDVTGNMVRRKDGVKRECNIEVSYVLP